jgi:hypothetical protein
MPSPTDKPECEIIGGDGNAFIIMGQVRRTLRAAGLEDRAEEFTQRARQAGGLRRLPTAGDGVRGAGGGNMSAPIQLTAGQEVLFRRSRNADEPWKKGTVIRPLVHRDDAYRILPDGGREPYDFAELEAHLSAPDRVVRLTVLLNRANIRLPEADHAPT